LQKPEYNAEIDFRDLWKRPERLFGYAYLYVLAALIVLGLSYVTNLSEIGKNSIQPTRAADSSAFAGDIPFRSPISIPPVDVLKVGVPSDSLIVRGGELFRTNCSSCHGDDGTGNGPAGAMLNPKPRNFHSLQGWTNGPKISQMYKTLQEGIVRNGMASYSYLPVVDRFALIHFVRTFNTGLPGDTPQELQELETTYQLSKGSSTPAQIPVHRATEIVLRETAITVASLKAAVEAISQRTEERGRFLFGEVVRDPTRVVAGLALHGPPIASKDDFVRAVCADPVGLGFKTGVVQLGDEEWSTLYQYIKRLAQSTQ
jgi:hypothetical protein